jgi:hypothetical protein
VPVNLLSLYVNIVARSLIAKNPRVLLETRTAGKRPNVQAMQDWINQEIERLYLANVLQRAVLDALFCIGIVKVALATPADAGLMGWSVQAGEPFCEVVDLDDFFFDAHARDFHRAGFIGHRFRVPLDVVKNSSLYKSRSELKESPHVLYNEQGDERIDSLGRSSYGVHDEFEPMIDLCEVYLPRHRLVLTLLWDDVCGASPDSDLKPLREQPWIGPPCGPYHILGLGSVPGNAMPKGPILDLIDLHEITNHVYRKIIRQAERQKSLLLVAGGNEEDAQRIRDAADGDIIPVNRLEDATPADFGGPNNLNTVMAETFDQKFSRMAGNLDLLGGLSPQSKTATQDKMLNEGASRTVQDMQERTTEFVSRVLRALCWYWWEHPQKEVTVKYSVRGMEEIVVPRTVYPRQQDMGVLIPPGPPNRLYRNEPFEELDLRVDPYSLQYKTPQERMNEINQLVTQIIIPMAPLLQEAGVAFDVTEWLKKMARLLDIPDLTDLITIQEPPDTQTRLPEEGPSKPAQTRRTYERISTPGRTQQGDTQNLRNALLGVNPGGNPAATARNGQMNGSP